MTALFLLPVSKGFVFTAIPRFTGTYFLTKKELWALSFLQILIFASVFFYENSILFYSLQAIDFGILFVFITHRFKISKVNHSKYLYFLLCGFFLGFLGSIFQLGSMFFEKNLLFLFGKDFIFYGMIPAIIFGVGTRMIPMIVNTENPTVRTEWMKMAELQKESYTFIILFILSFLLEVALSKFVHSSILIFLRGIRFGICTYWIIKYFHIFEISNFKGKLSRALLVSCYMFIVGLAGYSFGLKYSAHLAHIYLISGLSLLVLSIMTRVTLSHGGADMTIEKNSNIFYWIAGFIFIAAITRACVFFFPELTVSHLAYAAICYIIAFLIWIIRIGKAVV
jgi:uncharacterized protein involved in response to NO